jgi:uncharacterized repeat protein (TIGR03803 family)
MASKTLWTLLALAASAAHGQTFTVLHRFTGTDGADPAAGLVADAAGNLFGTTFLGGTSNSGTIFKLGKSGLTVLHNFTGFVDGAYPSASLIRDPAGNLFGTTGGGGAGAGVAFKLNPAGLETVLHSFGSRESDGVGPGELIRDSAGNLYGNTVQGGQFGSGTIFELSKSGGETTLYSFTGKTDGNGPQGNLLRDFYGNLYGTTFEGGYFGYGAVYTLDASGFQTVLFSFRGGAEGAYPQAGLVLDSDGNFDGTTQAGGTFGSGTVFKILEFGGQMVLYNFTGGTDGGSPLAGLVLDPQGNLYGTTQTGGVYGKGVVFKLDPNGTETVLHAFTGGADGGSPVATLNRDSDGNLYGTAQDGGIVNTACTLGCGVVFKIAP